MDFKLLGMLVIGLMILTTAFAYTNPTITSIKPAAGETLTPGTYTLDFNIRDYNGTTTYQGNPPQLKIYWSQSSGAYANLIIYDTNLQNTTGVRCADANFFDLTDCNYTWVIPSTWSAGTYYFDYNFLDVNGTTTYKGFTGSSGAWSFQTMNAASCGLVAWIAPLFGLLLAFFVVMQLMAGKFSPAMVTMSIAAVIGIVIVWGFSSAICVI